MRSRLDLIVAAGTALALASLSAGTTALLGRMEEVAWQAAKSALERSAQGVENALNRQLLQVDGALASLPTLFAAAGMSNPSSAQAGQLLHGLNFQTLAYRDLLLVAPDGTILASARARGARRTLPFGADALGATQTALIGPVRNAITGDWSLYVTRAASSWNGIRPVAEVPLPTLMRFLAEAGLGPGERILLQRASGELIAALPHDETRTGKPLETHRPGNAAEGTAFFVPAAAGTAPDLSVVRTSLYTDIRVVLTASGDVLLSGWHRDRDRVLVAASLGVVLICVFAAALLVILRQRERANAEREKAARLLANAIDAMSDGFVMWDENDRFVTSNERFLDLYRLSAPFLTPGMPFEEIIRKGAEAGQYPQAGDDTDRFVRETVAWHREGSGSIERLLPDGRWLLITERRTADGGAVGIRTDITALKTVLADLAQANARATEAADEARRQNAALIERESRIRFLAHHDDLTGLQNRVLFREQLVAALRQAPADGARIALLFIDLDRFKDVNDTLGHPLGDALLQMVAARLITCVDEPGHVARLGGDEFAVISRATDQPAAAERLSTAVIEEISKPYSIMGHTIAVSTSVGIAVFDGTDADADVLIKQADLALYRAKAQGRATSSVFTAEMDEHLRGRVELEADLRRALEEKQFALVYQPIYELASQRLCGFEALLRWRHPQRGLISPAEFVPVAEDTRLIVEIGAWVVGAAGRDLALLPPKLKVAVNLSPVQLAIGDIVGTIDETIRETALEPGRLELEITETALFASHQRNIDALRRLKQLGVRIVLDDFGTGYSSLSHLRLYPLDKIKIDRSFVRDMTVQPQSAAIVASIAALAHQLGMATTAEGIETTEQWEAARRAGCTEAQGYLLGTPKPILRALQSHPQARLSREAPAPPARSAGTAP